MSNAPVVSITDELVAELEASVCCVWPESNSAVTTLRALLSERAEMQQQLRAAMISVDNCELFRKDAERYQWLVANSFDKSGVTQFHIWKHSWEPHSKTGEQIEWSQRIRGPALDTFIDAAMQEDKP